MFIRSLLGMGIAIALVAAQQLPAPFAHAVVPKGDARRRDARRPQLTVPAGFTVNVFADKLQFARFMALAPNGDVFLAEPVEPRRPEDHGAARRRQGRRRRDARDVRDRAQSAVRPRVLEELSLRRQQRLGRAVHATSRPDRGRRRAREDRRPAAERRRARSGHREAPEHSAQPDARLQPLDAQRHLQSGRARSCTSRSARRPTRRPRTRPARSSARRFTNTTRMAAGTACSRAACAIRSASRSFRASNTLWTAVNERDHLGDDLVPDFITSVRDGGFYGWPYSYIGQHVDPTVTPPRPDLVAKAHRARTCCCRRIPRRSGLMFYTGTQFPAEYRNSAFVALHGSINRSKLSGYSVVRVPFRNGKPAGPPRTSCPDSSRATTKRRRRGAGRWACCSCPTDRCSCRTTAATGSGVSRDGDQPGDQTRSLPTVASAEVGTETRVTEETEVTGGSLGRA